MLTFGNSWPFSGPSSVSGRRRSRSTFIYSHTVSVNMCAAAVEHSSWLMVDPYETIVRDEDGEPQYVPTALVLDHFDHEINDVLGGVGGKRVRVCLLAGSDLVSSPIISLA
jgi:hypothetical protein